MSFLKDKIELEIQEAELGTQKALSQFPPLLRWFLILCLIAMLPAYYVTKNVSMKIWLSQYSQSALTAKPSFINPLEPKVSNVNVTTLGAGVYGAVVEVGNANLDLSAQDIPYQFNFYNAKKELLYSAGDKLFLLPNQTKYIAVPRFNTAEQVAYANFQLSKDIHWQKKLKIPSVPLTTSIPQTYQQASPQAFVVEGDFTNQSPYTLKQIRLNFILFNSGGKIIGVSQRDEFTVSPFERRTYKQLWPGIFAADLKNVKITADTNTLDPNNLIVQPTPSSGASDLNRPENNR